MFVIDYVEDECLPSSRKQKITLRLPATGPDSVGEIRSNRFGTYSRTERNCVLKLSPPNGYGVILTVLKIDFRNRNNCKDFIKVSLFLKYLFIEGLKLKKKINN